MALTLKRTVEIPVYQVYGSLKVATERTDIQEFLEALDKGEIDTQNDPLSRQIARYLFSMDLLAVDGEGWSITETGKGVLESGRFWQKEEGLYKIWVISNDPLIGEHFVHFERVKPEVAEEEAKETGGSLHQLPLQNFINQTYSLKSGGQTVDIQVLGLGVNEEGYFRGNDSANLEWTWYSSTTDESICVLDGELRLSSTRMPIDLHHETKLSQSQVEVLQAVAGAGNLEWHEAAGCIAVGFSEELPPTTKKRFLIPHLTLNVPESPYGRFDEVTLKDIAVVPANETDANQWRDWLVMEEVQKNYIRPKRLDQMVLQINQNAAFKHHELDTLTVEDILERTKADEDSLKSEAFWHLAAPYDLAV